MGVAVWIHPIASDRLEEWRALVAELTGPRRIEWAEAHRRHGITRQVIAVAGSADDPMSVVVIEAADPEAVEGMLRSSNHDFDVWVSGRLDDLVGEAVPATVVFDSAPRRGPWRGMRRPGRRP